MKLPFLFLALVAAIPCRAAVGIYLSSPESPVRITGGQSFTVDVTLVETFDQDPQVVGLDFVFKGMPATLTARDVSGSALPDQISTDAQATGGHDLGSLVDDLTRPVQPGTWHLGTYTLTAPASIVPGSYTLSFDSPSYVTAGDFQDHAMNVVGSLPVSVSAPEPILSIVLIGVSLIARRNRRRSGLEGA